MNMSQFCSTCGKPLLPDARFCSACGTPVVPVVATATRTLFRPLYDRRIGGVCAALSRSWGWDVGLLRILAVLGAIFLFPLAEIFYIACWIGIPEEVVPPPVY